MGPIVFIHRYLGVVIGVMMTLWCLSGFVMMYQSFPEQTGEERVQGLERLRLDGCCMAPLIGVDPVAAVSGFEIEMLAGAPVVKIKPSGGSSQLYDLRTGAPVGEVSADQAIGVARAYGAGHGLKGTPQHLGVVESDQWSLQGAQRNRPVRHIALNDAAGTELYISGRTGEVFTDTNRKERLLSWIGAIPHWLYPFLLRQNTAVWAQVVIWGSLIGVFLTATGLYVGIVRFTGSPKGRASPYKGLWMWHHMAGLFFGVLTLTWVGSGFLSMNPWGLLEGGESRARSDFHGVASMSEVQQALARAAPLLADGLAVRIEGVPLDGEIRLIRQTPDGKTARFDATGAPLPLARAEVEGGLTALNVHVASLDLLTREDSYYYAHHAPVSLPVWRAVLADASGTRLYIDAKTGAVRKSVDATARQSRWLRVAPHDFDLPGLRARPVWDLVVIALLAGVTGVCFTGTWLAFRRLKLDFRRIRAGRRKGLRR